MSGTKRADLLGTCFLVLLLRTAVAVSVDVTTAQDLYAALSNQAVTNIVVQQNLDLQDSLFFTRDSDVKLARDVVVRGRDNLYPILNLRFIPSRILIMPSFTLTFDSVLLKRSIGQSLHLGIDIVSSSVNSTVRAVRSVFHIYAGLPPEVPVLSVVKSRSPDYPGIQSAEHHVGSWCFPRVTKPVFNATIISQQVCWENVLDIFDVAVLAYALDTVDEASTPHYNFVVQNSWFVAEATMSWECLNAYGVVYCNTLDGNRIIGLEDQQDALLALQARRSHDKHEDTAKRLKIMLPSVLGGLALSAVAAALLMLHLRKRRLALQLDASPSSDTTDKWDMAEKAPSGKGFSVSDAKRLASSTGLTTEPGIMSTLDFQRCDSLGHPLPVAVMHSSSGASGHTQGQALVELQLAEEASTRDSLGSQVANRPGDVAELPPASHLTALHHIKVLGPQATFSHVSGHNESGPGTPDAGSRDFAGAGSVAADSGALFNRPAHQLSLGLSGSAISGSMLAGSIGSGGSLVYGRDASQPEMQTSSPLPQPHASLLHSVTSTSPALPNINLDLVMGRDVFLLPDSARGSGRFGAVAEGIYQGQQVAVKTIHAGLLGSGATDLASFGHEVSILSRCHHPNVVRLLGASLSHPNVFLVEELLERSLDSCAHSQSLEHALSIAHDVALGLAYLHPTIIHRDLKPANILLDASGSAKISDFGLARFRDHTTMTRTPEAGTVPYMAPECFDTENFTITDKADVFSLGVLMWELVAQKAPWEGVGHMAIAYNVHTLKARLPLDFDEQRCPARLQKLIQQCWDRDPKRRPAALSVVKQLTLIQEQLKAVATSTKDEAELNRCYVPARSVL